MRDRGRWLVPTILVLVTWGLTTHGKYSVSGDEPHYLMVSQSLSADGDIDVRNNYAAGDSRRFGVEWLDPGPHVRISRDGRLLPVHDVGLPIALLPVYVVATRVSDRVSEPLLRRFRMPRGLFAYSLISLFLIGVSTVAAVLTRAALISGGTSNGVATAVVLIAWLSPPVLSNSFLVFPEVIALLVTAWVVRTVETRRTLSATSWLAAIVPVGLLPWFHRKYIVYIAALVLAIVWRHRDRLSDLSVAVRVGIVLVLLTPTIALVAWTTHLWGAVGGALTAERVPLGWDAFRTGSLGLLVDRENGLFVWAPLYALLPVAWALTRPDRKIWLLPAVALFGLSAAHDQWWGGFSPAGRFLVPLVPIFCLFGSALVRCRATLGASLCLLVPQLLIATYGWQHARALWPRGDGSNRVLGPLLGRLGASDAFLPALRISSDGLPRALLILVAVAAVNAVLWTVVRRSRMPSDAS